MMFVHHFNKLKCWRFCRKRWLLFVDDKSSWGEAHSLYTAF